jgi:cytochrome b involved in lipid metabolism
MANLRKIKKDIDFLINEVISDCYLFLSFHPGGKEQEVETILLEAVNLRNDLYNRVNSAPSEERKQHYVAISKDLLAGVDKLFVKVSELSR